MDSSPVLPSSGESDFERQLRDMNEALIISSVRQHELTEKALRAEAELRKSEEQRQLALESAGLGTWHLDAFTNRLICDKRYQEIMGLTEDEVDHETAFARIHPDDVGAVLEAKEAASRPEYPAPYSPEFRVVHPDGSIHWVYAKGRARFSLSGNRRELVGFDGTVLDITDRKTIEESLRESEGRFRVMAEVIPQKIFTANAKGEWDYLNPLWMAITGFTPEALRAGGWKLVVHRDQLDETLRAWSHSMKTGERFEIEHRLRSASGQYLWHVTRALPTKDQRGKILLWVGSSNDVEVVKRADEEVRSRLEREVVLRTSELLASNEQLQGFTYSVAHDLRQQIRGISANASILMMDAVQVLDPTSLATLQRLVDSAQGLANLVDDLLTYARLGKAEPIKEPIDLTALSGQVAAVLSEQSASPLRAELRIAPGLVAEGDTHLIRVVVENLLQNAYKFSSQEEHPLIEVGRLGEAYFVRDNGIGFDMRFKHKLFEPFERLISDSKFAGTGIGLANVKRIVEKHGGKVWAEGRPGNGSTFFFTL